MGCVPEAFGSPRGNKRTQGGTGRVRACSVPTLCRECLLTQTRFCGPICRFARLRCMEQRRRKCSIVSIETRTAKALVAPHIADFATWQCRLAHLRGIRRGRQTSDEQFVAAASDLGELLDEVRRRHDGLLQVTGGFERLSRVRDALVAFERLQEQIHAELAVQRPNIADLMIIPPTASAAGRTRDRGFSV